MVWLHRGGFRALSYMAARFEPQRSSVRWRTDLLPYPAQYPQMKGAYRIRGAPPQREHEMSKEGFAGIFLQLSGWLSEAWGDLTGALSLAAAGRRRQILGKVRQESANARDQAARQLKDFRHQHRNWHF